MTKRPLVDNLIEHTVWVMSNPSGGFDAVDHNGIIITHGKFKSYLDHRWIKEKTGREDVWAIAVVVSPAARQPGRALPKRRNRRW